MSSAIDTALPEVVYGTPRKLPRPHRLSGRVVVLDIAFASGAGGASFDKVTGPFIKALDDRLAAWIDHHDHALHASFAEDPRFVLATKQEHGACPEMITPELVSRIGPVDTICCHVDFDGICAAAKWMLGGEEPYPGADKDAWCIDTRLGTPSARAAMLDRALRAAPNDVGTRGLILRFLLGRGEDDAVLPPLREAAARLEERERVAQQLAQQFRPLGPGVDAVVCELEGPTAPYDLTHLLLLGQKQARVAVVLDGQNAAFAAQFDSGLNLPRLFGLEGGMPTRVSLARSKAGAALDALAKAVRTDA